MGMGHTLDIRLYLEITPWGPRARDIACVAIAAAAQARIDPADLINAAIYALIRESCELPRLLTLRALAGAAHRLVNANQALAIGAVGWCWDTFDIRNIMFRLQHNLHLYGAHLLQLFQI